VTHWISSELQTRHDLTAFDCGKEPLNTWLREQSVRAQDAGTARTYVWTAERSVIVRAYYSIAPTQVVRDGLSRSQSGGYSMIPAYLVARLAIDRSLQGQGLGAELLVDAVARIVRAAGVGGGRLIVLDALDDSAAHFYQRHDFKQVTGNPLRLIMTIATARAALGMGKRSMPGDLAARPITLVLYTSEGRTIPVVLSTTEVRAVVGVMETISERELSEGVLRASIITAIGRNPFDQEDIAGS